MTVTKRLSPIHDQLELLNPCWGQHCDMPVALHYGQPQVEIERCNVLALCDVSSIPRISIKGPGAEAWLAEKSIKTPQTIYDILRFGKNGLVVRTGNSEFFIEDDIEEPLVENLLKDLNDGTPGTYRVLRQDASFLIIGKKATEVLAETCGVDFTTSNQWQEKNSSHFQTDSILEPRLVLTRVAGVSCSILKREHLLPSSSNETVFQNSIAVPTFQLWLDGSFGVYLWHTLLEIMAEQGGGPVGLSSLFPKLQNKILS